MNKRLKVILLSALALIAVLLVTSCSSGSPYEDYDGEGYGVSVRYDANGGTLTDGVSVIVDTYGLDTLPEEDGKRVAQLIAPEDTEARGAVNKFVPRKSGYTCVGWYAERTEVVDENGDVSYTYANRWDFENDRLELDPNKEYSAQEPVLTLYAAWVPNFRYEFYSIDDPDTVIGVKDNVKAGGEIIAPMWDLSDDSLFMGDFPTLDEGKTYIAVYADPEGTQRLSGEKIKHTGTLNYENATAVNPVMKLYIEAWDGEWKHVYSANQLTNRFSLSGNYVIMDDIDFRYYDAALGEYGYYNWQSTNINNEFKGKIVGYTKENGEAVKIKNITFTQASTSNIAAIGLFGKIGEDAVIKNIDFVDMSMTIDKGAPMAATMNFGLLAGRIDDYAQINNVSVSGKILISSECIFRDINQISIGLVCGAGKTHGIDYSDVVCEKIGDADSFTAEIVGDKIELSFTAN